MANLIKGVLSRTRKLFTRLALAVRSGVKAYKYGGVANFTITQVEYTNLLEGKRILITGGTSGIGLALAKKCVDLGAIVIITGRNQSKLDHVISNSSNRNLFGICWDVRDIRIIEDQLKECRSKLGGDIDVLVNNAGVIDTTDFFNVNEEAWNQVYDTNSKGVFFLTQAVCNQWVKNNSKVRKVINISSQAGYVGATYPYRMSKWDIAGLTQGLGLKLCNKGIIVNGIAPGIVATKMQPQLENQEGNIYCPHNPIKRFAIPEEIAELGVYLISDASNFIVGQTIVCDGGFSIK